MKITYYTLTTVVSTFVTTYNFKYPLLRRGFNKGNLILCLCFKNIFDWLVAEWPHFDFRRLFACHSTQINSPVSIRNSWFNLPKTTCRHTLLCCESNTLVLSRFFFFFFFFAADVGLFLETGKGLTCAVITESIDLRPDWWIWHYIVESSAELLPGAKKDVFF